MNQILRKDDEKPDSFKVCKLITDIENGKADPKIRKKRLNEIFIIIKKKIKKK